MSRLSSSQRIISAFCRPVRNLPPSRAVLSVRIADYVGDSFPDIVRQFGNVRDVSEFVDSVIRRRTIPQSGDSIIPDSLFAQIDNLSGDVRRDVVDETARILSIEF